MTPEQMAEAYRLAAGIVEHGANTGPTYDTDNPAWCVGDREVELLAGAVAALQRENAALKAQKDGAYEERNRVVAALACCFPAFRAKTAIEGWSEDWHGCVYIDLPTGQASWHYHDSQARLFAHVPERATTWDGHTTEEKYQRLQRMCDARFALTPSAAPGEVVP